MCLYTRMVLNPKYLPNKKNGYNPPKCTDERLKYIPVTCQNCEECRKAKQREWRVRMLEEIKSDIRGKFVTLTFTEEWLDILEKESNSTEANQVTTKAIRLFLERWRAKHKKSLKHWFITELGHKNTERVHIHGIIFTDEEKEEIEKRWGYGRVDVGYSMNEKCVNYVMKYILKVDEDHKNFRGRILVSPGIGKGYIAKFNAKQNKYVPNGTDETYRLENGAKVKLPTYYRNKIYTEEQREELWKEKLSKNKLYVNGQEIKNIDTEKGQEELEKALRVARRLSLRKNYGGGERKKEYMTRNGTKREALIKAKKKMINLENKIKKI